MQEDEPSEAGNQTVASQEELMRGLKQFIQDTMTSSFNPKDTPFPELHSFTARLAGGKKISISVVCGAVQAAHLPTQRQRQRIQALMAEDGHTPTLTQRRLDIEHAGGKDRKSLCSYWLIKVSITNLKKR